MADDSMNKEKFEYSLREIEFEDLHTVFKIGEKLFTAKEWPNLYRTWDEYEILERFMNEKEFCLVAECKQGEIIGFAIGSLLEKRKSAWKYGYLIWLGVLPEFSGRHVGRKLLKKMTTLFQKEGARIMIVDTEVNNEKAIGFFKKHQFKSEHKHIYLSKKLK